MQILAHNFFLKLTAETPIKHQSYGMYEEKWYFCDLRKQSCANGGLGKPILGKKYSVNPAKIDTRWQIDFGLLQQVLGFKMRRIKI